MTRSLRQQLVSLLRDLQGARRHVAALRADPASDEGLLFCWRNWERHVDAEVLAMLGQAGGRPVPDELLARALASPEPEKVLSGALKAHGDAG